MCKELGVLFRLGEQTERSKDTVQAVVQMTGATLREFGRELAGTENMQRLQVSKCRIDWGEGNGTRI